MSAQVPHPLAVVVAVVGAAVPAALFTELVNGFIAFKDSPRYPALSYVVLAIASAFGGAMYALQLRLDPNVPRIALVPAVLTSLTVSAVAAVVALVFFAG